MRGCATGSASRTGRVQRGRRARQRRPLAASPAGREALGELLVDAPRPDLVRFILPAPDPSSTAGSRSCSSGSSRRGRSRRRAAASSTRAGCHRAAPARSSCESEVRRPSLLARNTEWWGTDHGLGPGVDQIEMRIVTDPGERLGLLRDGTVQVADLALGQTRRGARRPAADHDRAARAARSGSSARCAGSRRTTRRRRSTPSG